MPSSQTVSISKELLPGWIMYNALGTADYFHVEAKGSAKAKDNIMGSQLPHGGKGYAGIIICSNKNPYDDSIINHGEFLENELTAPLIAGHTYLVTYYISLADRSDYSVSGLNVLLTKEKRISRKGLIKQQPQIDNSKTLPVTDTKGWTRISGTFTATGNEKFLVIGKFQRIGLMNSQTVKREKKFSTGGFNQEMCYYYIDDVSMVDLTVPKMDSISVDSINIYNLVERVRLRSDSFYLIIFADSTYSDTTKTFNVPNYPIENIYVIKNGKVSPIEKREIMLFEIKWEYIKQ